LFNLLAESPACIAVILFTFANLIRHDGSTKGKKKTFSWKKNNVCRMLTNIWGLLFPW
jgi:hypothetical protein